VGGAAVGIWLADAVAEAVAVLVTVAVAVGVAVAVCDAEAVDVMPGVLGVAVLPEETVPPEETVLPGEAGAPAEPVAVAEPVTEGEKTVGVDEDEVEVQAETAARASRVRAPQQTAVSRAPSAVPATVVRTFIEPPHARGR
jgi:hypothetical protein